MIEKKRITIVYSRRREEQRFFYNFIGTAGDAWRLSIFLHPSYYPEKSIIDDHNCENCSFRAK